MPDDMSGEHRVSPSLLPAEPGERRLALVLVTLLLIGFAVAARTAAEVESEGFGCVAKPYRADALSAAIDSAIATQKAQPAQDSA
jgi:hypothetical protein